ncbi:phosphoglycerate kinase [Roseobacter sp. N2S]|uniref:phosphoglycerate kinase n=1 Tax=Roseobacter sp. N2S TaxID=2663844 RepID=UPI0028553D48|nr:phosphoglycerate kinase [Roseobacter sp. N2S]MDR6266356.1 phosphoglycerate kinase [Roseobacter sp. N2S]
MSWKTLDAFDLAGKRVLTRVDINVPMSDGKVTDATRIERIVPTVKEITAKGGRVVLLAHFGRPKGENVPELSLAQLVPALSEHFGQPVQFTHDDTYAVVLEQTKALKDGDILLVENTRFYPGETANDPEFAEKMAAFGDIYCNDAFSAAHRAHASTEGVARHLPSCAGRLMQAELEALENALSKPQHPVVALVGGAKVSTKLDLLGNLIPKVDQIIIGGGMANTFLAAQGINVGKSLCEHDLLDTARKIIAKAKAGNCELVLPVDVVTSLEFKAGATATTCAADACPADQMILDAGPQSVARIKAVLDAAKTLVWNGPLGAFEIPPFNAATDAAALHAAALSKAGRLLSVAGGGDTVAALNSSGAADDFSYISTAGGAFLEWLEGKTLPGVAALVAAKS